MLRLWWVVWLLQWELSRRRRMLLLLLLLLLLLWWRRLRLGRRLNKMIGGVRHPLCCYRSVMLCLRLIVIRRMMLLLRP
jgi:hypothetical protein